MRRDSLLLLGLMAVALLAMRARAAEPTDLVATVNWTAPGSQAGSLLFQGKGDGGILHGNAFAGSYRLVVEGTISDEGAVSGTLATTDGTQVGSFSAQIAADQQLHGSYAIFMTSGGWTAPAQELPVPEE